MNFGKGCFETDFYEIVAEYESYIYCRCKRCGDFFKVYK